MEEENKYIDNHGKMKHIFIESVPTKNMTTGEISINPYYNLIWVDQEFFMKIREIPGVCAIRITEEVNRYQLEIDIRYDSEFVKKEIEALVQNEVG